MYEYDLTVAGFDPELWAAVEAEAKREEEVMELIASENYVSPYVLAMQGSILTNKYAEGYPGKRYYGGCECVDRVERLAIERAKELFKADYANVQPHSGSQANAAVYMALARPGDTILGMALTEGGHLTHGAKVNFSGQLYHAEQYGLDANGEINYQQVEELANRHRPKVIVAGFSAYSRRADWQRFREIADRVNAYLFVDMAHVAGLVAAGLYPSPVPIADVTTTTTHKTLRGPRSGLILAKANPELEKRLNTAIFPVSQGGPLMHIIAAKAIALKEAMDPGFKIYQQQVILNARTMANTLIKRGYKIVSGGTDNHLFLVSFLNNEISGKEAETALGRANLTVNKNTVPGENRSPFITSGIRIGTPAMTTRGLGKLEAEQLADWICDILDDINNESLIAQIRLNVLELCRSFPVYKMD